MNDRAAFTSNNFDLLRLFAATQVMIFHCYNRFDIEVPALLKPFAWFPGVPIFFILSGYLIASSLERSEGLASYARKRALRIFPGLWGVILATLVAVIALGYWKFSGASLFWLVTQLSGLIYTPAFLSDFGDGSYNGSLWTIPVELQFYVALPIVYAIAHRLGFARTRFVIFAFLCALAVGGTIGLLLPDIATDRETLLVKLLRYTFIPRFYMFLFGVMLFKLRIYAWPVLRGKGLYWLAVYLLYQAAGPDYPLSYIFAELFLGLTMFSLAYTLPSLARRVLRDTDLSYGVYLYHGLVINVLMEFAVPAQRLGITLVLTVLAAFLSWHLIERPMIGLKFRRRPRPSRESAVPD